MSIKTILVPLSLSLALLPFSLYAGGIDRTGQPVNVIFEDGNFLEISAGNMSPSVRGVDESIGSYVGGMGTGNVLSDFQAFSLSYKHQIDRDFSISIILDQPYGVNLYYPVDGSLTLGGTSADVKSTSLTGIVRYKLPSSEYAVHGGVRATRSEGTLALGGALMGQASGYRLKSDRDVAFSWLAGFSWERPDLAARISLTYHSPIRHDFNVIESGPLIDPDGDGSLPPLPLLTGNSKLNVTLPESWNLEFQAGLSPNTLLFGSIRLSDWSSFRIDPERLWAVTGSGLVDLDDSVTFTVGIGHRFNEYWSGASSFSYEKSDTEVVSPFSPVNGSKSISLSAIYTREKIRITTGVTYTSMGDSYPSVGGYSGARLSGSHALGVGMKMGYSF